MNPYLSIRFIFSSQVSSIFMFNKSIIWYQQMGYKDIFSTSPISRTKDTSLKKTKEVIKNNIAYDTQFHSINRAFSMNTEKIENTSRDLANSCENLDSLYSAIQSFDICELKKLSTNTVIFDGNAKASIMLIGEAPGATEDEKGIPFCGQSGKLLDNILASIGLNRTNTYITNTIFWRPPGNRRPTKEELDLCRPFVEKHIALIKPKLILMVGSTSVESLLRINQPITKIRRQYLNYNNQYLTDSIKAIAIFHPSYLLRQQRQKKLMWFDMIEIKNFIKTI